ncbi:divalent-cation tolerance protein CutA [Cyanobium sp. Morenito 9A2]|uniref:divalent-cation tolerance protein CutA n=1 Tax=Cyanobium sp. Morenito 9A2 TaxID=2823718 RepID=UPI0020CBE8E3|nr:divalent-cation tolerance protein CutA [Cyanobium sp. Morenito 9A2]MCP9849341.1 divalent-cation tolerance protein CutA [Cyanobium sp. Morenito 9A2]
MSDEPPLELVLTSEANQSLAEALARDLLERRLVACVSLQPLTSLYRWQGQLECSEEVQLLIKTHPTRLDELKAHLHQRHSYETPEWIHWSARSGGAYGSWVAESCDLSPGVAPPAP